MKEVYRILQERDDLSIDEIDGLVEEAREMIFDGEEPQKVMFEVFGLEEDYIFDII